MTALHSDIMNRLYGEDLWQQFLPEPPHGEIEGWNGDHPALERLMAVDGVAVVVDVGVWKGQSTVTMAREMKRLGLDGCVIAVDTFLGSPEHWDMALFGRRFGIPDLYRTFLSNVWHAGVADYVVPMPQTSVNAAAVLRSKGIRTSVVHVDASHEYEEVRRDVQEYWTLLRPGGWLIGDDYDSACPGVIRAAGEFSAENAVGLEIQPPKWLVRKPPGDEREQT